MTQDDCPHDYCTESYNHPGQFCNQCGMIFLICKLCTQMDGTGSAIYHSPPMCELVTEEAKIIQ